MSWIETNAKCVYQALLQEGLLMTRETMTNSEKIEINRQQWWQTRAQWLRRSFLNRQTRSSARAHHRFLHGRTPCRAFCAHIASIAVAAAILACSSASAQKPVNKAWSILQTGLSEKSVDKRAAATSVLGLLEQNPQALSLALAALGDAKPEVRAAAAKALGDMGAKSAVPKLVEVLKGEKEPSVVLAGAHSLVALGDPLGYAVYYAILTGERKSGGELLEEQRKMLTNPKQMAMFGFEQGIGFVPFAGIGYGAFKALHKDDVSPVRAASAKVLANDPDPKSAAALVEATSDKSWIVRAAALNALSHRGDPGVLPQIESSLQDEDNAVLYTAAAAVIHLSDIEAGTVHRETP